MREKKYTLHTKVFFKEDGWEIHGNPLRHKTLNPAHSRVVHYCDIFHGGRGIPGGNDYSHVWAYLPEATGCLNCPSCGQLMPDSIQTLWTLQNFDVDFSTREAWRGHLE